MKREPGETPTTKLLLLADGRVGNEVYRFLARKYPSDIKLIVCTEENVISDAARRDGFTVVIWTTPEELCGLIEEMHMSFQLGLTAWWPYILKQPLISLPKKGFINFHPSFLPHNRGKHYNFWAIVEEAPFGVSLHFVDEHVDTGDIVVQRRIEYDWSDTGETLYWKAQDSMVKLFVESYPTLRSLHIPRKRQNSSEGSFHKSTEIESASVIELDQLYTARKLLNLLRARTFAGHPACRFKDSTGTFEARISIKKVDN